MITKVAKYMKQNCMVKKGDALIVGVSGGADSVCLLSVLTALRGSLNLNIICAHVNHMFRRTALRDEQYVQELCNKWGICYRVKRIDVSALATEQKISFEEAGRNVRYAFFRELKEEYHADKIAIAHNKEDCAETMLFHLFRGSDLKGLGGISPVHEEIIRPLLGVTRQEIEAYLEERSIAWQTDETNESTEYARNHIRHKIFPVIEDVYPGVRERIAETAFSLQQAEKYLEEQTSDAWERCCKKKDDGTFIAEKLLLQEHPFMVSRLIYKALELESGSAKDLTKVHVQEVIKLLGLQAGRKITLPRMVCAYRTADGILIRRDNDLAMPYSEVTSVIHLLSAKNLESGLEVLLESKGLGRVTAKLLYNYDLKNIPQKTYTKWFDYDKITKCAVFRKRLTGDYLTIDEQGNRKSLKEYFIQEKIPAYKRDEIWVLADDNHIIWVPGYRISSFYKVSEKTERVLELTIGGKEDE